MGQLLTLLGVLAAFFAFIGVCWLVAAKLGLLKSPGKNADSNSTGPGPASAYSVREEVLSPGERAFLPVLETAVRLLATERNLPMPRVLASVRLAEVLKPAVSRSSDGSAWQSAFNRIKSKQADFVVCHPETTKPLLVVELDDQSHDRADRKDRDGLVDQACESAGLPIVHVRAAAHYDATRLAVDIAAKLPKRA